MTRGDDRRLRDAFAACVREGRAFQTERAATIEKRADGRPAIDLEARTVMVAFSSEEPVARYWGSEILDHSPGAADLSRLADGTAAVLVNHRADDLVGVVERALISKDRRGRAVLRFGKSARASEVWQDVVDGIRSQVSVGYFVLRAVLEETGEDGEVFRVTSWQPVEISLAAIAADPTVGVGRALEDSMTLETPTPTAPSGLEVREAAPARERHRIADIESAAARWNVPAEVTRFAIENDWPASNFQSHVLKHYVAEGRALATPPTSIGVGALPTSIGLVGRELGAYSITRAIRAAVEGDWRHAPLEREASDAVGASINRSARRGGFLVPYEALAAPAPSQRAAVAKGGSGGNLIATDLLGGSFIDQLRNRMVTRAAGATLLPGLVGDVAIPRRSGGATTAWVTEGGGSGDTPQTYDQVVLSPKTIRARSDMTRKMLLQSTPAIEQLTRDDLALAIAIEVDRAALVGSGSGAEPRGVLNTSGVGSVSFGATVGGVPTWPLMVQFETEVAIDNADAGALAFIINPKTRGKLRTVEKSANTGLFLFEDAPGLPPGEGRIAGYRALVTSQAPGNLAEGGSGNVLSAAFFGNWADLLIGEWGTLEILAEAVTLGDSGGIVVRAFWDVDIALRHVESFSAASDVITA